MSQPTPTPRSPSRSPSASVPGSAPRSAPPAGAPPPAPRRGPARILGVIVAVVALLFAARLAGLYQVTRMASRSEAQLAGEIEGLGTEVAALQTQQAVAGTDGYVERWAREERGWVQDGDQPFAVAVVTALPTATPTATPPPPGVVDRLRRWLRRDATP